MEEQLAKLEKRIAALEELSQKRQVQWEEICESWEEVLINFCIDFAIPVPERLKQKELQL